MSDKMKTDANHKEDDIHPAARPFLFLGKQSVKHNFMWIVLSGMIICIVLGFFFPQKHPLPIEKYIPGSWAVFGFLAYSFIVLCAPFIFKVLARDENYYGEGGLPDPEYSTEHEHDGDRHD
ncbi:MAG: hypothetical protein ABJG88_04995 [Litorimonas sp.]